MCGVQCTISNHLISNGVRCQHVSLITVSAITVISAVASQVARCRPDGSDACLWPRVSDDTERSSPVIAAVPMTTTMLFVTIFLFVLLRPFTGWLTSQSSPIIAVGTDIFCCDSAPSEILNFCLLRSHSSIIPAVITSEIHQCISFLDYQTSQVLQFCCDSNGVKSYRYQMRWVYIYFSEFKRIYLIPYVHFFTACVKGVITQKCFVEIVRFYFKFRSVESFLI